MMYLFHRVEERLDGTAAIIVVDEGWKALDDDVFVRRIKDWEKTIRKRNGIVGFATQSAQDALESRIASAIIEQAATQIFMANPKARAADYIEGFGLTPHEYRAGPHPARQRPLLPDQAWRRERRRAAQPDRRARPADHPVGPRAHRAAARRDPREQRRRSRGLDAAPAGAWHDRGLPRRAARRRLRAAGCSTIVDCQAQAIGAGGYQALAAPGSTLSLVADRLAHLVRRLVRLPACCSARRRACATACWRWSRSASCWRWRRAGPPIAPWSTTSRCKGPAELAAEIGRPAGAAGRRRRPRRPARLCRPRCSRCSPIAAAAGDAPAAAPGQPRQPPAGDAGRDAASRSPASTASRSAARASLFLTGAIGALAAVRLIAGLLLALGPFFIAFLLFDGTRGLFEGWMRVLAGAALGRARHGDRARRRAGAARALARRSARPAHAGYADPGRAGRTVRRRPWSSRWSCWRCSSRRRGSPTASACRRPGARRRPSSPTALRGERGCASPAWPRGRRRAGRGPLARRRGGRRGRRHPAPRGRARPPAAGAARRRAVRPRPGRSAGA